jgi:hypothetical protein
MHDERPLVPAGLDDVRAAVLVEGASDRVALESLARRRGRDLGAEGVAVVPIGGAQAIGRVLDLLGRRLDVRLAGLCDAAEERARRDARWSGPASDPASTAPAWSDSASTSASWTSRTSSSVRSAPTTSSASSRPRAS